jgi:4-hydroxyphenylpyruvate dioxygenase
MSSSADPPQGLRTAIATVCLSGSLEEKLPAAAAAGFDGVEIFEPDLVASPLSPAEVRIRCADLGLSIDLYQPFRDFEAVPDALFRHNLRRAERKFDVMQALGTDLILACSSCSPDALDDDDLAAEQLHALAARAAERGMKVAYEALAWGRFVSTWDHSWDVVRRADHPALGLCLDSFHVLSRGSDTAGIAALPAEKLLFLQLADAPAMDMDILQWSRHHRLFPGQGSFDLVDFVSRILTAGYTGPLSLEVFNDVFRQSEPRTTAVDALRSLLALQEAVARDVDGQLPTPARARLLQPAIAPPTSGFAFCELGAGDAAGVRLNGVLAAMGFRPAGRHRSKPVTLWEQGAARMLVNTGSGQPAGTAEIGAFAITSQDVASAVRRAEALLAPVLPRVRGASEAQIDAVAAPDGTAVFFCPPDSDSEHPKGWRADFLDTGAELAASAGLTGIDHIALTQPFDAFAEASLFFSSVLGLRSHTQLELSAPFGMLQTRAMRNPEGTVRVPLSVTLLRRGDGDPALRDPQHVAFGCTDILAAAAVLEQNGTPLLAVPDNYFDDLDARLAPDPDLLADLRKGGILYDRDGDGEFFQLYTEVIGGRVFFEVVQRVGGYQGYGAVNAPVHLAAHHRMRHAATPDRPDS